MAEQQHTQFAVLTLGGRNLAFPQSEIATLELTQSIRYDDAAKGAVGVISFGGENWPVFGFDESLGLLNALPETNRFCACIRGNQDQPPFAVACDAVSPVVLPAISLVKPLPDCMDRLEGTPITHLFRKLNDMVMVSTGEAMVRFIGLQGESDGEK